MNINLNVNIVTFSNSKITKGVFGLEGVGEWKVEGEWEWKVEGEWEWKCEESVKKVEVVWIVVC